MGDAPIRVVARIITTHGLKGEVSVAPAAGLPFVLESGMRVWVVPPTLEVSASRIQHVRPGPKGPLVKLEGVDDIDAAATLRARSLACDEANVSDSLSLPYDPTGIDVFDEHGDALGSVAEVIVTGANDVWVVRGGTYGEVLLPVIDDVVLEVDQEAGRAIVHLLDGLVDGRTDDGVG